MSDPSLAAEPTSPAEGTQTQEDADSQVQSEQPEGNAVEAMDPKEQQDGMYEGGEQNVTPAQGVGFNPSQPVATSAPPPEWQSGKADLNDEGVQARPHAEQSITDPGSPSSEGPQEGDVASRRAEQEQTAAE